MKEYKIGDVVTLKSARDWPMTVTGQVMGGEEVIVAYMKPDGEMVAARVHVDALTTNIEVEDWW